MNIPNIPIELIIVVLFFVLPALGSLQKWRRERSGKDPKDARAPRSERQPTTPTPSRPLATPARADTSASPARSQAEGWLEEAQRRVREARQEEADAKGRGSVNPRTLPQTPVPRPVPKPAARPSSPTRTPQPARPAQGPVQTRTPPKSLEGRTLEGLSLETTRSENASLESPYGNALALDTAPPMRVQRLGGDRRATITRELRFDERSLVTGFIWHQVLSPPLSKSRRTRLSRRQP